MNMRGKTVWLVVDHTGPDDEADVSRWKLGDGCLLDYIAGVRYAQRWEGRPVNLAWHDDELSAREDAARRMARVQR